MTFILLETEHSFLHSTVKAKVITKYANTHKMSLWRYLLSILIAGTAKGSFPAPHKLHIDLLFIINLFVSFNMS